jgi:hypothetical protein
MRTTRRWTVEILVGEEDGRTYAEAHLDDDVGNHLRGNGLARRNPADPDVPEVGDEIAAGRALTDLGRRLLRTAAVDLQEVTHQPVNLPR